MVGRWQLAVGDESGNVCDAQSVALDCEGCYIRSTGPRVIAVGVRDLVVVITHDVAMVLARSESQRVKEAQAAFAEAAAI